MLSGVPLLRCRRSRGTAALFTFSLIPTKPGQRKSLPRHFVAKPSFYFFSMRRSPVPAYSKQTFFTRFCLREEMTKRTRVQNTSRGRFAALGLSAPFRPRSRRGAVLLRTGAGQGRSEPRGDPCPRGLSGAPRPAPLPRPPPGHGGGGGPGRGAAVTGSPAGRGTAVNSGRGSRGCPSPAGAPPLPARRSRGSPPAGPGMGSSSSRRNRRRSRRHGPCAGHRGRLGRRPDRGEPAASSGLRRGGVRAARPTRAPRPPRQRPPPAGGGEQQAAAERPSERGAAGGGSRCGRKRLSPLPPALSAQPDLVSRRVGAGGISGAWEEPRADQLGGRGAGFALRSFRGRTRICIRVAMWNGGDRSENFTQGALS